MPAGLCAGEFERFIQNDRGRDAIDVIIAVNFDLFVSRYRVPDAADRAIHVAQQERVMKVFYFGMEKSGDAPGIAEAALK
jgi:hypothetical protein